MRIIRNVIRATALLASAAGMLLAVPAFAAYDSSIGVIASCSATDRAISTFSCSSFPTGWILGTSPTFSCYAGATAPTCAGANTQYSCNSGSCICSPGYISCSGTCQLPIGGSCAVGQTLNQCTGACEGTAYVTLQTGTPTRQGAAATNATISVHGNLDLAGGTQGDVYLSSGKAIRVDAASATSLNLGNFTTPGSFTLSTVGDFWLDDSDTVGKGIQLESADRPLITRGTDTFTSGAYSGIGRWGLFKESNALTFGAPNVAGMTWKFRSFNADSTAVDRLSIDAATGNVTVNGNLTVTGTISGTGGMSGSGTTNFIPKFSAASTLADSAIRDLGTEVLVGYDAGIGASSAGNGAVFHVGSSAAAGTVVNSALFSASVSGAAGVAGTGAKIVLTSNNGANRGVAIAGINTSGSSNAHAMTFETNAGSAAPVERMRLTSAGRLGIGTTAPATMLDVVGDAQVSANLTVDTNTLFVDATNNRVGIGTVTPTNPFEVFPGTGAIGQIGVTRLGGAGAFWAAFQHIGAPQYGLYQENTGRTLVNSATGQVLGLRINNVDRVVISDSGDMLDLTGMTTYTDGMSLGGKLAISGGYTGDTWLRLNQSTEFTSGVYTPGNLRLDGTLRADADANTTSYVGRNAVGYCGHSDYACVSHIDRATTTDYALLQSATGQTFLNSASGSSIYFRSGNSTRWTMDTAGNLSSTTGSTVVTNGWMLADQGFWVGSNEGFVKDGAGQVKTPNNLNVEGTIVSNDWEGIVGYSNSTGFTTSTQVIKHPTTGASLTVDGPYMPVFIGMQFGTGAINTNPGSCDMTISATVPAYYQSRISKVSTYGDAVTCRYMIFKYR